MSGVRIAVIALALFGVLVAGGWYWWTASQPPPVPVAASKAPPAAVGPGLAPASAPAEASAPAIEPPPAPPAPLAAGEVDAALVALFGSQPVQQWLQTSDFPRRFVASVDNLGRAQAPASVWPVKPAPGRFSVEERGDGSAAPAADNAERYAPFVALAESVDAEAAVALYARLYPLLQQAYVDLGYPRARFHDRLVQVIDQLLATPPLESAPALRLVEVKGPIASTRPWVRYEFVDPRLESLSAGQKILLRTGPDHARRLKARLIALREALQRAAGPAAPR